jgi:hypothetical protein
MDVRLSILHCARVRTVPFAWRPDQLVLCRRLRSY